jgi:hypothetical protein
VELSDSDTEVVETKTVRQGLLLCAVMIHAARSARFCQAEHDTAVIANRKSGRPNRIPTNA